MKQNVSNIKELNGLLQNNKCVIYGAGYKAKAVVKYCEKYLTKDLIEGIVVTARNNNFDDIYGMPVKEISSYSVNKDMVILVCTASVFWNEIEECINKYMQCTNVYYLKENIYEKIQVLNYDDETTEALQENAYMQIEKLDKIERKLYKLSEPPCIDYMIVNILYHCNLKCQGCDHFACIADEHFVSYESICHDVGKISQIMGGDLVKQIAVMGGEPLLHPDLLPILKLVRKNFPHAEIRLTTNGILLLQQNEEFWRVCREYNIHIVNTKYPINLDYDGMIDKAKKEDVVFYFYEGTGGKEVKTSFNKNIDLEGNCVAVKSFFNCDLSGDVAFINEGKVYPCPFSCMSNIVFNNKFNQNLRLTEGDYLIIDEIKSKEEIFKYLVKPKYYCRYCGGEKGPYPWARTRGNIAEWILI